MVNESEIRKSAPYAVMGATINESLRPGGLKYQTQEVRERMIYILKHMEKSVVEGHEAAEMLDKYLIWRQAQLN